MLTRCLCLASLETVMRDRPVTDMKSIVCMDHCEMTLSDVDQEMRQGGDSKGAVPAEGVSINHSRHPPIGVSDRIMRYRNLTTWGTKSSRNVGCEGKVEAVHFTCRAPWHPTRWNFEGGVVHTISAPCPEGTVLITRCVSGAGSHAGVDESTGMTLSTGK